MDLEGLEVTSSPVNDPHVLREHGAHRYVSTGMRAVSDIDMHLRLFRGKDQKPSTKYWILGHIFLYYAYISSGREPIGR